MTDRHGDRPASAEDATRPQTHAEPAVWLGPYRLLHRLGEGGMGEVWLAEQTAPVRRQVAIKVIKAGMDTAHVVARFDAERQALAVMDHPAIAKVFDAGATSAGRPYFAMEYVRGESITAYCTRHHLPTRSRLDLFLQVCDGVQHAHQKGVIHRDLKPSNVLVTLLEGKPVPKIIDFGVAKAIAQPLTDRTLVTELGAFVGTPEYMSPEQAEMTGLDIDTRTDVYALGVILYELLTGVLPFDATRLREKGLDEIRRVIREDEPTRPSVQVARGTAGTAPPPERAKLFQLASQLRGDLDWITMRALEKDRTRRYGSAADLAADVQRHLDDLPILASPPSTVYRAQKFIRRHRLGVTVAAALVVLLAAFSTTTALQARRVARERDRANEEVRVSERVTDFLVNLFRVSDPSEARGNSVTARELLDDGARQIERTLQDQPEVQARLLDTIGRTYDSLGLYSQSEQELQRALDVQRRISGPNHQKTTAAMAALARVHARRGEYEKAEQEFQAVLDIQRRTLNPAHKDLLAAQQDLGWLIARRGQFKQGEQLVRDALDIQRRTLGNDDNATLRGILRLAGVMNWQGRYAEVETLSREVVDTRRRTLGPDDPETIAAARSLAGALSDQGRLADAEQIYRDALERARRVLGPNHPNTASAMNNLAFTLHREKHVEEAEQLYRESLDIDRHVFGPEGDATLQTMNNLGLFYLEDRRRDREAEETFSALLEISTRVRGPSHRLTLMVMNNLALASAHNGRFDAASTLIRKALSTAVGVLGDKHPMTAAISLSVAEVNALQGRRDDALRSLREAVDHGFRDADLLMHDDDLKALRGDSRFDALVAEVRRSSNEKR